MFSEVIIMASNPISIILKQQRNIHEMTPEQVVTKLNERGFTISTKALYAYESGTNLPKVPVFLALCDIYNIRDIMGSFGYSASVCIGDNEWGPDQYEDFFKVTLYEKIFLLAKWGIPSFEGYETLMTQPAQFVLSDNEIKLINTFRAISPESQGRIWNALNYEFNEVSGEKAGFVAKEA